MCQSQSVPFDSLFCSLGRENAGNARQARAYAVAALSVSLFVSFGSIYVWITVGTKLQKGLATYTTWLGVGGNKCGVL